MGLEKIYIKDVSSLNKKISELRKEKIMVLSDFDKTFTRLMYNGEKHITLIAQIRDGGYLSNNYPERATELYYKYYPFENDTSISFKKREEKMREWWSKHIKLLVECGLNKQVVDEINNKKKIKLRMGAAEFLRELNVNDIPLLIISSGVGDMIEFIFKSNGLLYNNMYILSNFFKYDENGMVLGYKNEIIHTLSKSKIYIENKEFNEKIKNKTQIILLGDMLSDLRMKDSFDYENILTIGFLNEDIQDKLQEYMDSYDIVIANDGSFNKVLEILSKIK